MAKVWELSHLMVTVFLYFVSTCMLDPAIPDIMMEAICPGENECALAIYMTGLQHTITGVGVLVALPVIGILSDTCRRKALLTIPLTLGIFPFAILAISRTKSYFYAFFVLKTLTAAVGDGGVMIIATVYAADCVSENYRASVFGILSGLTSFAFIFGNFVAQILSISTACQVATLLAVLALVYMALFLPESTRTEDTIPLLRNREVNATIPDEDGESRMSTKIFKNLSSFGDSISFIRNSPSFTQAAVVSLFNNMGNIGSHVALNFYLKARFDFQKDQFANLMMIAGIAGTASQMLLMPILAPYLGEKKLLLIGLFFNCTRLFLLGIAWTSWVVYFASMLALLSSFAQPSIMSIVSKQVGPDDQGKAQGCISAITSLGHIIVPLIFSPLYASFLSPDAPFPFPGFSMICAGLLVVVAFVQSLMIKLTPRVLTLQ